jgi:glycosyltransferase involved in cell wall biosynthesis
LVSREEGLGISAIEGSACGLPIVVTRCTGLIETVIENETGFSFEKESLEDLCEKLLCLIDSQSRRKSMGLAGRAYVQRKFSASAYGQGLIDVANRMIERRTR